MLKRTERTQSSKHARWPWRRILLAAILVVLLGAVYLWLQESGMWRTIMDRERLVRWITELGVVGPIAIVALMALAIVLSPLPSAPIALAAGAAYGHGWGTLYVLLGAELGALTAFMIARVVGYEVMRGWFGDRLSVGLLGSQNAMTAIVLVTRLMPFLSFDVVSYAAGLTPLRLWRFALATLAGVLPASFLLAHFGSELASADTTRIATTVLVLGLLTGVPIAAGLWRRRFGAAGPRERPPEND